MLRGKGYPATPKMMGPGWGATAMNQGHRILKNGWVTRKAKDRWRVAFAVAKLQKTTEPAHHGRFRKYDTWRIICIEQQKMVGSIPTFSSKSKVWFGVGRKWSNTSRLGEWSFVYARKA